MPFTPLIGLSTFMDILLIMTYNLFNLKSNSHALGKKNSPFKTFLGSLIIIVTSGFVLVSAVLMVGASAAEKHSSVHFIEDHISYFNDLVDRSDKLAINFLKTN